MDSPYPPHGRNMSFSEAGASLALSTAMYVKIDPFMVQFLRGGGIFLMGSSPEAAGQMLGDLRTYYRNMKRDGSINEDQQSLLTFLESEDFIVDTKSVTDALSSLGFRPANEA